MEQTWSDLALARLDHDGMAAILRCTDTAVVVLDPSGSVRFANPAAQLILAYDEGALLDGDDLSLIHPDDQAAAMTGLASLVDGTSTMPSAQIRLRHRDGGWRSVEIHGHNLLDDPHVGGLLLTLRDLSAQRDAETALAASVARFEDLAGSVADFIFQFRVAEPAGLEYANAAAIDFTGYSAHELLDQPGLLAEVLGPDSMALFDTIDWADRRSTGSSSRCTVETAAHSGSSCERRSTSIPSPARSTRSTAPSGT